MKGSEAKMLGFMEGADKRYVIPVYQRKYNWKYENCQQLYDDLKKIAQFKKIVALSNLIQRIYHNDIRNMLP